MTFLLRKPRPDEAHALADLHVATWRETYTHLLPADFFSESYVTGRYVQVRKGVGFVRSGLS